MPGAGSTEKSVKTVAVLIALAGVLLALWLKPDVVSFWEFKPEDVVRLFTQLILIALFIERAIEVMLTPWRGEESEKRAARVKQAKKFASAGLASEGVTSSSERISQLEDSVIRYKSDTRQIAFLVALALGMTVSAVGVRGLQFLAEPQAFSRLSSRQTAVFTVLDVLLTGALLAGGSDGLHKVLSVFTNYMDKTSEKLKTQ